MLAAIGVGSIERAVRPDSRADLRLGRPLELPTGISETEVYERLAGARRAQRRRRARGLLPRRRDVRPLRAGDRRRDHPALGVPDPLHALPAGDLPGRPAGDVRVPDRDVGADRRCRSPAPASTRGPRPSPPPATWRWARPERRRFVVSRGVHPAQPRDARAPTREGYGAEVVEVGLADGLTDAAALAGGGRRARPPPSSCRTPTSSARSRTSRRSAAAAQGARRAARRRLRPDDARGPAAARRVRRRHRRRRGPAARQPARLRRALVRLLLRHRGAHPPHAGPDRRRDRRRRRPPRLRPRPADPRAAHPPREGDPQHLHRAGAERARGDGPPRLARPRRASASWASCWSAAPPMRASGWPPSTGSSSCTTRRWCASSRSASTPRSTRCSTAAPSAGSPPATRSAASTPSTRTACWSRSPSGARREQIDALAEALGRSRPRAVGRPRRRGRMTAAGVTETPMQRERAVTIFEKSKPGRRAAALPAAGVPERPLEELIPAAPAARRAAAAARDLRARDRPPLQPPLAAQLRPRHRLLPARLLHDEAQPAPQRAGRGAARPRPPAPGPGPAPRPGRAGADVAAAASRWPRSAACRTSACSPRPARTASSRGCC